MVRVGVGVRVRVPGREGRIACVFELGQMVNGPLLARARGSGLTWHESALVKVPWRGCA